MAKFEKILDKELFSTEGKLETTKFKISIRSYNEGSPKLQITRENLNLDTGAWRWSKLGRITKIEAEKILELITKSIEHF